MELVFRTNSRAYPLLSTQARCIVTSADARLSLSIKTC